MSENSIDVVMLWVDGSDKEWIKQYNKYAPANMKKMSNRYRDWDTIRYVLRGIEYFMPWVRKIHFVTCGQRPKWMVEKHEKLNFVSHFDIFDNTECLPVFNSSAIELNIHRIPELADTFIYFNDDMLVLKPTNQERFFKHGLPVDFLLQTIPRRGIVYEKIRKPDSWSSMINNCVDLVNIHYKKQTLLKNNKTLYYSKAYPIKANIFNFLLQHMSQKYFAFKHYHHPQPYLRKNLLETERIFKKEFDNAFCSRFRSKKNLSQAIFRYAHLAQGNFYPGYFNDHSCVNVSDEDSAKICIKAIKTKRFVCVNDELKGHESDAQLIKSIMSVVDNILPQKSSFEI